MTLQNYFQLWIVSWFISIMILSILLNWKIYYPEWSTRLSYTKDGAPYHDEYKILLYRLIIMVTTPLSWLYLIAKYAKTKKEEDTFSE